MRIPAVLVIPGNVGYLKQFFSAQLFVANGAPVGSGLTVKNVTGTVKLPPGADHELGTDDDPLALPDTVHGPQPTTLPVLGVGPDGKPGTEDDDARFAPGEQGQAEFLIRGEREGFHSIDFDIAAVLEGLVSGPVTIKGKASGGVLVRNPFFDMTFTVPSVVRRGERFKLYATVTNIGQGIANDVTVSLDAAALSGARLVSDQTVHIDTLRTGDSKTVAFELESQKTGQVVASYLKLEGPGQSGGTLRFALGVGERGVPLSPDTLVLPAAVDAVPVAVLDAAMRVLGQAWSVANAPSGTLPRGVLRTSKAVVVAKALALAEAGLRIGLGQDATGSIQALDYDFFAGTPRDPGFDQLLHDTEAGQALRQVFGGPAPTDEPSDLGGPRLVAASVIGPEVLAGAGPFGLHAILVFDRILDGDSAAVATRYVIPNNTVRVAKAVLSGRLVILSLAQPEGPYVPTTVDVNGVLDLRGRRGGGSAAAPVAPRRSGRDRERAGDRRRRNRGEDGERRLLEQRRLHLQLPGAKRARLAAGRWRRPLRVPLRATRQLRAAVRDGHPGPGHRCRPQVERLRARRGGAHRPRHRSPRARLGGGDRARSLQPPRRGRQGRGLEQLRSPVGRSGHDRRPGPLPHRRHHGRSLEREGRQGHRPRARGGPHRPRGDRHHRGRRPGRRLGEGRGHGAQARRRRGDDRARRGRRLRDRPCAHRHPGGLREDGSRRPLPVRRDAGGCRPAPDAARHRRVRVEPALHGGRRRRPSGPRPPGRGRSRPRRRARWKASCSFPAARRQPRPWSRSALAARWRATTAPSGSPESRFGRGSRRP